MTTYEIFLHRTSASQDLKHFLRHVIILLKLINQRIYRQLSHLKMAIFEVYCEGVVWGPTKEETLKPQILLLLTKQISWCGGLLPSSVSSALARKTLHSTHHFWQQQQQTDDGGMDGLPLLIVWLYLSLPLPALRLSLSPTRPSFWNSFTFKWKNSNNIHHWQPHGLVSKSGIKFKENTWSFIAA